MIASTLVAAALASTNPTATAPTLKADHHAGMASHHDVARHKAAANGKMACCKGGCECCAEKSDVKAEAKPAG